MSRNAPNQSPLLRVLIVDDACAVREALAWALEADGRFCVVGQASSVGEALEMTLRLRPDLLLLDLEMPAGDSLAVGRAAKGLLPAPALVCLSVRADGEATRRCGEAGGDALAAKGAGWDELRREIERALTATAAAVPGKATHET